MMIMGNCCLRPMHGHMGSADEGHYVAVGKGAGDDALLSASMTQASHPRAAGCRGTTAMALVIHQRQRCSRDCCGMVLVLQRVLPHVVFSRPSD
jgi:hypothetical protein